nr:transposase [Indiicoccus explosivorum]
MDMSQSFKAAVREALGRPVIIADRFRCCRYIHQALDRVRKRIQSDWGATTGRSASANAMCSIRTART